MGQITYTNLNRGVWDLFNFHRYDVTAASETEITLTYGDEARAAFGAYDIEGGRAYRVVLDLANVRYQINGIPAPDTVIATRGTVTGFTLFDRNGDTILTATGLAADLPSLQRAYLEEKGFKAFSIVYAGALKITGADETGTLGSLGENIQTGFANDLVRAGKGDDLITDFGGKDRYVGGAGMDMLGAYDVKSPDHPVVANLGAGTVRGTDGKTDTVSGIEGIRGTNKADRMTGDGADNIFSGLGGKDVFDGRSGLDLLVFADDANFGGGGRATVNLARGFAIDGFGARDTLANIEGAIGTDRNDRFIDNGKANFFHGATGDDSFTFSGGRDLAQGGPGADLFVFLGARFGADRITDFEDGTDRIRIAGAAGIGDLVITDDGADKLIAFGASSVRLDGLAGATIDADDFLFG